MCKPDPATSAKRERERADSRQHESDRITAAHARAASEAAAQWAEASETGESPYLTRKGVQPHGVRFAADGWLLVPLRDEAGQLCNVQRIAPAKPEGDGPDKLFLKGGQVGAVALVRRSQRRGRVATGRGLRDGGKPA